MTLNKISEAVRSVSLRSWQNAEQPIGLKKLREHGIYVCEGCTGSGKTTHAVALAAKLCLEDGYDEIVIVAPSVGIKDGWAETMAAFGFVCTSRDYETLGQDAYAFTYAGINAVIDRMETKRKRLGIIDEFHHGERDRSWGDTVEFVFKHCDSTIFLSGTPWKTNGEIAVLKERGYYKNGYIEADTVYRYGKDLEKKKDDRATVYADFKFYRSEATEVGSTESIVFESPKPSDNDDWQKLSNKDCDIPLGPHVNIRDNRISNNKMARHMIDDAVLGLETAKRETKNRAMGLIVGRNITELRQIYDYMTIGLGLNCEIIVSDDDKAADRLKKIRRMKHAERPDWLLSVGMVSEGVDIPEIKIIVYLSAILTLLYLIQVIGRALRRIRRNQRKKGDSFYIDNHPGQTPARIYMPAHPFLLWLGLEFEKDKQSAENKAKNSSDKGDDNTPENKEWDNKGGDAAAELRGGNALPEDLTRMYRLLVDDDDARQVMTDEFSSALYDWSRKNQMDIVREILGSFIERFGIEIAEEESFEEKLDYDTRVLLARKEAQRLTALIRFSHPRFKTRTDDDHVFKDVRVFINKRAGIWRFSKAPLEEKEKWCKIASDIYEEGRHNG